MGGGISSERVAASNRNGWRDQLGIRNEQQKAVTEAVKLVASSPTRENKTRLFEIIKNIGRGAMSLVTHASEIEHVVAEVTQWVG